MRLSQQEANELRKRRPSLFDDPVHTDAEDSPPRIRSYNAQPAKGDALVRASQGEDSCWYGTVECATGQPRFAIQFIIYAVRPADWDGWHIKELQDALVACRVLPDDSWKHIEEGSVATRKVHKASEERTEIRITPL